MKPYDEKEWRSLKRAEKERRLFDGLMEGKLLGLTFPDAATRGPAQVVPTNAYEMIKDWMSRGLVVGLVPLLSEEGKRYFAGLKAISEPMNKVTVAEHVATLDTEVVDFKQRVLKLASQRETITVDALYQDVGEVPLTQRNHIGSAFAVLHKKGLLERVGARNSRSSLWAITPLGRQVLESHERNGSPI